MDAEKEKEELGVLHGEYQENCAIMLDKGYQANEKI